MKTMMMTMAAVAGLTAVAAPTVQVVKEGANRIAVSVEASGSPAYLNCLKRNLELSGVFRVAPGGAVRVAGTAGAGLTATGRGKQLTDRGAFGDDKSARVAARRFSDAMVEAFSDNGQKGFAMTRIAFANRKGPNNSELYMCYPDGLDIRQVTSDGRAVVGPRWSVDGRNIYYIGYLQQIPDVYKVDPDTGARGKLTPKPFAGGTKGVALSPAGNGTALILTHPVTRSPELYVMDRAGTVRPITNTPKAAEASPVWSPDGRKIAYVTDQTRNPQVWIVDVASRKAAQFTRVGRQNTHPDWSKDGKLCWTSLREGQWVVMSAPVAGGEAAARPVTDPGTWQDPSWTADGRHLVASRDNALFVVDTEPDGEKPVRIFPHPGNWMNPACSR